MMYFLLLIGCLAATSNLSAEACPKTLVPSSHCQSQPHHIPEESKEQQKEEPKEQAKEESKEQQKEEPKEQAKEKPKEQAKEKPKEQLTLMNAIALTLKNQLDIQLSIQQFRFSEGVWQSSAGPFDPILTGSETYTELNNVQNSSVPLKTCLSGHDALFTASLSKKTRAGTIFSLDVVMENIFDPSTIPARLNNELIAFNITQPLLQGFLYGLDTMIERANAIEFQATYFDLLQQVSERIYNTTQAYWEMVAAKKIQQIQNDSLERFTQLIKDTEKLIAQDQLAKADLVQPLAQLALRQINVVSAQQNYFQAFEDLKFAMNIVEETPCIKENLFDLDNFPKVSFSTENFNKMSCNLLNNAAYKRYDILAAQSRELANEYLVQGSINQMLPQLNVVSRVAHKNFSTGQAGSLGNIVGGPAQNDWMIGLNFSIPFNNDRAKGDFKQARAKYYQAQITTHQIKQLSLKDLRAALANQIVLAQNLKAAEESVKQNEILVKNERKRISAGFSTIFFLVNFENSLTDALIQQVLIEKQYFQNIARIRFLSATLFNSHGCLDTIQPENITSLDF